MKAFLHSHTYSGNPLGCAAALAVQQIMREDHVLDKAAENAGYLAAEMQKVFGQHKNVGEIRHIGLINAMELVADKLTKAPLDSSKRTGYQIYKQALKHGLVLRPLGDVLYFNPALNISRTELDEAIKLTKQSMAEILG